MRAARPAAPGAWSGWVWVTTIQRMRRAPISASGVEMRAVVGPGVDHDQLVGPHQIGVGPRAGHHAGVRGRDPDHERRQPHGPAGLGHGRRLEGSPMTQSRRSARPSTPIVRTMAPTSDGVIDLPRAGSGRGVAEASS